jgi:hypothetical protein
LIDLEALGLLPEQPRSPTNGRQRAARVQPAPPEDQRVFDRLMALARVRPQRGGDELLRCPSPDHEDQDPSCSVNWPAAVFHCFACGAGGGIGALRRLLGEEARPLAVVRPAPARTPLSPTEPPSEDVRKRHRLTRVGLAFELERMELERERGRLAHHVKEARLIAREGDRQHLVSDDIIECHRSWWLYEARDSCRSWTTFSCGFRLCPSCTPTRLYADFERHRDKLPERFAWLRVTPPPDVRTRPEIRKWFKRWLRASKLEAGFYGIRLTIGMPDVLLVVPAGGLPADLVADAAVTLDSADADFDDTVSWYQRMCLEEVTSWRTTEEMLDLHAAVKGCRRFQGFGKWYERRPGDKASEQPADEPKKVYKASGGSAKGGAGEKLFCPHGERLRRIGKALTEDERDKWMARGPPQKVARYAR